MIPDDECALRLRAAERFLEIVREDCAGVGGEQRVEVRRMCWEFLCDFAAGDERMSSSLTESLTSPISRRTSRESVAPVSIVRCGNGAWSLCLQRLESVIERRPAPAAWILITIWDTILRPQGGRPRDGTGTPRLLPPFRRPTRVRGATSAPARNPVRLHSEMVIGIIRNAVRLRPGTALALSRNTRRCYTLTQPLRRPRVSSATIRCAIGLN